MGRKEVAGSVQAGKQYVMVANLIGKQEQQPGVKLRAFPAPQSMVDVD
jgi:hypothetical protein